MRSIFALLVLATISMATTLISSCDVIRDIDRLTDISRALIKPADEVHIKNAPHFLTENGPLIDIIDGLKDIVNTATSLASNIGSGQESGDYDDEEAEELVNAIESFVDIHTNLLEILVKKQPILEGRLFIGRPIAAIIRAVHISIDSFTDGVVDALPENEAVQARAALRSLAVAFDKAIRTYGG
ncbi:hypothetical protein G7046_g3069 [Stylonectria norvegica]|nr:hypothetical protein G7046_g3069 [Stylonectria norvegica]